MDSYEQDNQILRKPAFSEEIVDGRRYFKMSSSHRPSQLPQVSLLLGKAVETALFLKQPHVLFAGKYQLFNDDIC